MKDAALESQLVMHGSTFLVLTVFVAVGIDMLNQPSWLLVLLGAAVIVGSAYTGIKYIRWNIKRRKQP